MVSQFMRRSTRQSRSLGILAMLLVLGVALGCQGAPDSKSDDPGIDQKEQPVDSPQGGQDLKVAKAPKSKLTPEKRAELLQVAMQSIPKADDDKTLSPYFFVLSDDPGVDQLPLKSTGAEVNIAGVIAEVKVSQLYKNEGDSVLEAIYIFPTSTRAAVYAMKMRVGDRVIQAKIKKRHEAREEYEQARRDGKTASLLEQQRPNVFQMNVANILPGDEIEVEMSYTELLVPEDGIYEFVYPTVVGPRYSETKAAGAPDTEKWVENPHLHEGEKAPYSFHLGLAVRSGMPIAKISSPSHEIEVEYSGKKTAHVALKGDGSGGNRDFVLRYSLAGKQIETGLLLYPGEEENFFLLMMEPPAKVGKRDIVPREYIFILDVSGSMHGFPLNTAKTLMRNLLGNMRRQHYFNVLLFSGSAAVLSPKSLQASGKNIDRGIGFIGRQRGSGGTRLLNGLQRALDLPHTEGTSRIVVVVTDGYVSVEKDAFELIRNNLSEANLFAFGIGSSVNRFIIEGMARAGQGEPLIILKPDEAAKKAAKFREYISAPVLQGIELEFDDFEAYSTEPKSIPDLFAKRPVIAVGKYRGQPKGAILVKGHVPGEKLEGRMNLEDANISKDNSALRYLWARRRIMQLADMNKLVHGRDKELIDEVTRLGLEYNLMTEFTSFVAVDQRVRTDGSKTKTVKQPVPLPQGVSDTAVGGKMTKRKSVRGAYRHRRMRTFGGAGGPAGATPPPAKPMAMAEEKAVAPEPEAARVVKKEDSKDSGRARLSRTDVHKQLKRFKKRLQACYEKHVSKSVKGGMRITVTLTIGTNGRIKRIVFKGIKPRNKALEKCLRAILKRMRLPAISSEQTIRLPLILKHK